MPDASQLKRDIDSFKREEQEAKDLIAKKENELRRLDADLRELKEKFNRAKRKQEELTRDLISTERKEKEDQKKKEEEKNKKH